jgi:hypothetical protein
VPNYLAGSQPLDYWSAGLTSSLVLRRLEQLHRCRENPLGVAGWAAVADALERVTGLTSLNGCGDYAAICAGGLEELKLNKEWELGVWAGRFLVRSARTLTKLDVRYRYHMIILVVITVMIIVISPAYRFSPPPPTGPQHRLSGHGFRTPCCRDGHPCHPRTARGLHGISGGLHRRARYQWRPP